VNNAANTLTINIKSAPRMKSDDCPRRCCGVIELKRGVIIAGPVYKVTVIAPITETSVPMILAKPPYSSFSTLKR